MFIAFSTNLVSGDNRASSRPAERGSVVVDIERANSEHFDIRPSCEIEPQVIPL
jgi:hypothetical protein